MAPPERVALLKPDHLGDLVLSIPAIRKLREAFPDLTLFCHPAHLKLAHFLFPGLRTQEIRFPHLMKEAESRGPRPSLPDGFDLLLSLRRDQFITADSLASFGIPVLLAESDNSVHETFLQKQLVASLAGDYSRTAYFFGERPVPAWHPLPERVGLCVSAGFASNHWPITYWTELAHRLATAGIEVHLIGGPRERDELRLIQRLTGLPDSCAIVGGGDFGTFLDAVGAMDLVIASDSGTAHLCSLVVPMLSLFGPSSYRRYAPFGAHQRVLSLNLACGPCTQFQVDTVNLCLARECLSALLPEYVANAVTEKDTAPARLMRRVSHTDWNNP